MNNWCLGRCWAGKNGVVKGTNHVFWEGRKENEVWSRLWTEEDVLKVEVIENGHLGRGGTVWRDWSKEWGREKPFGNVD